MTEIWAFDPGTVTGVAIWTDGVFIGQQLTVTELYEFVDDACDRIAHAQIEKFTISAATLKKARVDDPLDVIGYLKYAAWRCGFPTRFSKPADVMASFTDAALKRAGMFTKGKQHANDAARHLARSLVLDRHVDPKIFMERG